MSTDPLSPQELVIHQNEEILERLKNIEAMLRKIMFDNSPASLAVEEKARIIAKAMTQGKDALKAAAKRINGM